MTTPTPARREPRPDWLASLLFTRSLTDPGRDDYQSALSAVGSMLEDESVGRTLEELLGEGPLRQIKQSAGETPTARAMLQWLRLQARRASDILTAHGAGGNRAEGPVWPMAEASKGGVASGEVLETFLVGVFHKDSALDPEWANVLASALADRWTAYTAGDQQAGELVLPRPGLARDWWFVWLTTKGALLNPSAGGWDVRPEVQYLLMLGNLEERLQWDSVVKYIKEDIKGGLDERWARSSGALMRFPAVSRLHLLLNRYLAAVEKPTPHPPRASIEETRPLADGKPDMNADIVVEPSVLPGDGAHVNLPSPAH